MIHIKEETRRAQREGETLLLEPPGKLGATQETQGKGMKIFRALMGLATIGIVALFLAVGSAPATLSPKPSLMTILGLTDEAKVGQMLMGTWVRTEDDAHVGGLAVEIHPTEQGAVGKVAEIVAYSAGWQVGMDKWNNFRVISDCEFVVDNLAGSLDNETVTGERRPFLGVVDYETGILTLQAVDQEGEANGTFQVWVKQR